MHFKMKCEKWQTVFIPIIIFLYFIPIKISLPSIECTSNATIVGCV